ncbi:FtsX-like permease family protein [Maioricimonas sp. JC845]|uniref:ABC transporter permease n=1 Tax=Maioricimonas sp. JC845 TaxID=3232138 RepID=UPI003458F9DB
MYKYLLASRYLRTRFIALASIISVTLGVATMIVVNSVMTGFSTQMKDRIHGILADIMVESTSTDGATDPERLMAAVEEIAGPYIDTMTPAVEIYGMMSFDWHGQSIHQPVTLIGILPEGKHAVSPLAEFLMSRQALREGEKVVRQPLRPVAEPLDWELTSEAEQWRSEWMRLERLRNSLREQSQTGTSAPETVAAASNSSAQDDNPFASSGDAASYDPFDPASRQATDETAGANSPAAAASPNPLAMFDAPAEKADPDQPLPARVYVGLGLVSFPYKDGETGETRTMTMVHPGEDVAISTIKTGTPEVTSFKATVVDLFKSGMSEYDSNLVFCNLEELQLNRGMLDHEFRGDWTRGSVTSLQIKLKSYDDAPRVVELLRSQLPLDYGHLQVRTWEQKQGPLLEAVAVESAILNVLLFLIIAVAGFGILAIFYMIVVEKTRDIGIMKALGASSRGIMTIFLSYGLALGVVGSTVGVFLGLTFVHYINEIEDAITWITGRKVFDETIYYFQEIPTAVHPSMVLWVSLGAMAIAVLASVLPARRAARLHPVQALRYE